MSILQLIRGWDAFFFKPISPLSIGLFRILFGVLLLVNLLMFVGPDFLVWYGPYGIGGTNTCRIVQNNGYPVFDVLSLCGTNTQLMAGLFCAALIAAVSLTVGFCTRLSAAISFLFVLSLHNHDPFNLNACDNLFRIWPLLLSFSHAGRALSVDEYLRRKRLGAAYRSETYSPWAQRLIQLQLTIIYWQASVWKLVLPVWINGEAIYYSTRLQPEFILPLPYIFDNILTCKLLGIGAVIIETCLWTLIWIKQFRYWVLAAGVCLHLGIDLAFNLPLFEWLFVITYVCFIEPEDLVKVFNKCVAVPDSLRTKLLLAPSHAMPSSNQEPNHAFDSGTVSHE